MIRTLFTLLTLISLLLPSCGKNEFRLEFNLPANVSGTFRSLCYASDKRGGKTMEQIAVIADGQGVLNVPARNPAFLFLYTSLPAPLVIYAKRGQTIKISGDDDNPATWKVEGNDINRSLTKWRNENAKVLSSFDHHEINRAIASFVEKNLNSEISSIILLTNFWRADDETLFRILWQELKPDAEKNKWASMLARADLPTGTLKTPGQLRSIALRSLYNGVDTICPARAKATLIYFWHSGASTRKNAIDSLRVLSRQFPDSASRIIADVCLDADSLAWHAPLQNDSINNIVRLWTPQGRAATQLLLLDVPRTPFYIVFSNDGNQKYRGSDLHEACVTFRSLMGE